MTGNGIKKLEEQIRKNDQTKKKIKARKYEPFLIYNHYQSTIEEEYTIIASGVL